MRVGFSIIHLYLFIYLLIPFLYNLFLRKEDHFSIYYNADNSNGFFYIFLFLFYSILFFITFFNFEIKIFIFF